MHLEFVVACVFCLEFVCVFYVLSYILQSGRSYTPMDQEY